MIGSLKKKNNLASMIRGKAIEEAIRFAFAIHRNHMSIPAAQNYANDIYYLRTKNLPTTVIKNNAKPINSLVRAGIKAFTFLKIKNLKNNDPYKINKSRYCDCNCIRKNHPKEIFRPAKIWVYKRTCFFIT